MPKLPPTDTPIPDSPNPSTARISTPSTPPPPSRPARIYLLPNRLHYVASTDDINDPNAMMRIGQINSFLPTFHHEDGSVVWIGITTAQIFSPRWQGFESPPLTTFTPLETAFFRGTPAYEIQPVTMPLVSDYTSDREEMRPTGRVAGRVVAVNGDTGLAYVEMEGWFTQSEMFRERGTWRDVASGLTGLTGTMVGD